MNLTFKKNGLKNMLNGLWVQITDYEVDSSAPEFLLLDSRLTFNQ